jgi:hypothetical protein
VQQELALQIVQRPSQVFMRRQKMAEFDEARMIATFT